MWKVLIAIVFVVLLWLTAEAFVAFGLPWWTPLAILGGAVAIFGVGFLLIKIA